jgi:hypothetical protein
VAEALGISKESLSHIKKRGTVPLEAIAYFCAKRKISINWDNGWQQWHSGRMDLVLHRCGWMIK